MSLDLVDLTNHRLDHLPVATVRAFAGPEMAVDAVALAKTERDPELTKLCEDIPSDSPIIHIFLDPNLWREKRPVVPILSRK